MNITDKLQLRFWEKVNMEPGQGPKGECWQWTASLNEHGYGQFNLGPRGAGVGLAHRVSYELVFGPLSDGLLGLHECDNPACVRPDHIKPGTQLDNMRDMASKGRCKEQKRTHCPKGHPYDEENTKLYQGRRYCKACARARNK